MKVLLISHVADIDGVTPVILSKIAFGEFDYELYEVSEVNQVVRDYLENGTFDKYDFIFIVDLTINYDVAKMINESVYKDKIAIFDHHLPSLELEEFDFSYSKVENENGKVSGTSLYYDYLKEHYGNSVLMREGVSAFVELVRLNDTWEWKAKNNLMARDLAGLHALLGNDDYIARYFNYLTTHETFEFTQDERLILQVERRRIDNYIDLKDTQLIRAEMLGHSVGIVFAELYRSELGNDLAERHKDELDFIVIVNVSRSISYRGLNRLDLNSVAEVFGGHGHYNAAGSPLPEGLRDEIIGKIFGDRVSIKK